MAGDRGRVRVGRSTKRVRAFLGGECVADCDGPVLVWEVPYYPAYYFPLADVRTELLVATDTVERSPSRGTANHYTVKAGTAEAVDAAWRYEDSPIEELRGLVRFDWQSMDAWFEEDEEVFTHPRDPHSRVDVLASTRTIRVEVGGTVVAESSSTVVLHETGLPRRWYFPQTDVRMDLLEPIDSETHCPYKGQARYWDVIVAGERHENLAWSYRSPFPESAPIAGRVCFYDERVDLSVDGVLQERPKTHFA